MALITKPDMEFIWASGGAVVKPSDVKIQTGWTPEVPPHQWENWIQKRQDEYLAHINQRGIPEWDALTEYEAGGLSYVQGTDGKIYKSVAASGPSTTTQDPTLDGSDTYWTVAFADVGAFLTQTAGDVRYAQRSNNLSDLIDMSTARVNLGVQNAVEAGIQNSFSNLKLSSTGLNALVTITADSVCVKNSSNFQVVLNNISITPSIASSGANGLDTGTSSASTWYSVWVIWNGTTVAGLLSLSATSPTLPSGYTHKARVGWIRTDGTVNKFPLPFVQAGDIVDYAPAPGSNLISTPIMSSGTQGVYSGAAYTPVAVAVANYIPPTAVAIKGRAHFTGNTLATLGITAEATGFTGSPGLLPPTFSNTGFSYTAWNVIFELLLRGTSIYWASASADGILRCTGWEDNL